MRVFIGCRQSKGFVFTPNINVSINCLCAYDSLVAVMLVF